MWIVRRNGKKSAVFKTKEAAIDHRNRMERVSISLKQFKDKWSVVKDEG